jgi:transposase-like protein
MKGTESKAVRDNARNSTKPKRLKSQYNEVDVLTPRDWDGSFEFRLLRKNKTPLT